MRVVVTGAAGFLGRRVVDALLARTDIGEICAFDRVAPGGFTDPRVTPIQGDITDPAVLDSPWWTAAVSAVFHLAAIVSGQAEAEFELGMRVNVDATRALLERVRQASPGAKFVTTSSVAVFGGSAARAGAGQRRSGNPPAPTAPRRPSTTCCWRITAVAAGWTAAACACRPSWCAPGLPNRAASSFASGIIREPVNGVEAVCPVPPETLLWLMSPGQAIRNILHGFDLPAATLGRPAGDQHARPVCHAWGRCWRHCAGSAARDGGGPGAHGARRGGGGDRHQLARRLRGRARQHRWASPRMTDFDSVIRQFLDDDTGRAAA